MLTRLGFLVLVSMVRWPNLEAAQVTYSNLLPPSGPIEFVKTDASGNFYLAGGTTFRGSISKVSSDLTTVVYTTIVDQVPLGPDYVSLTGLAVAPDGSAYVADVNSNQISLSGGITKVDPSGKVVVSGALLEASGYPGCPGVAESILDMVTDAAGNLYLTGVLCSSSNPAVVIDNARSSGFTYKFDSNLHLLWTAPYGGSHIAVDNNGNAYVVGSATVAIPTTPNAFASGFDGLNDPNFPGCGTEQTQAGTSNVPCPHQYVLALSNTGSKLLYATFLTGSFQDVPAGIAVDASGNAYVAGSTHSFDFPVTAGVLQAGYAAQAPNPAFPQFFSSTDPVLAGVTPPVPVASPVTATGYVAALNPSGSSLIFSTFFGGSATDLITAIALDPTNQTIDLGGNATSPDLPGIEGAYSHCVPQSFIARLTLDGTAAKRTALIPAFYAFAPGINNTVVFSPATAAPGSIGNVNFEAPDSPIACLASSLDLSVSNSVTPGQLLTIFGDQIAGSTLNVAPKNDVFPTSAAGVQVTVGGVPAPILYVSSSQINLQVPFEVSNASQVDLQLTATNAEGAAVRDSRALSFAFVNPNVLQRADAPGDCPGSYLGQTETYAINADGSRNSCTNPAQLNSTVTIFVGGFGIQAGQSITGSLSPSESSPLAAPVTFVPLYSTLVPTFLSAEPLPGSISGLYRMQLQLPASALNGIVRVGFQVYSDTAQDVITIHVN